MVARVEDVLPSTLPGIGHNAISKYLLLVAIFYGNFIY